MKETLEELKKSYESRSKYYEQLITEKDKVEKELLRLEGAINITNILIGKEEEKKSSETEIKKLTKEK